MQKPVVGHDREVNDDPGSVWEVHVGLDAVGLVVVK
jgi:hypothetical protein